MFEWHLLGLLIQTLKVLICLVGRWFEKVALPLTLKYTICKQEKVCRATERLLCVCALWQFICYLIASRWMWPFLLITLAKPILYSHKRWETLQHKRYQIMFLHWFGKNDQLPLTYSMEGAVHGCWKSSKKKDNGNLNILSENRLIKVMARLFFFLFLGVNTDNWEMVPLCRGQPPVRMFRPICVCV